MKTMLFFFIKSLFLLFGLAALGNTANENKAGDQLQNTNANTLEIVSSPELFDLASGWMAEFGKNYPDLNLGISPMGSEQPGDGRLCFMTDDEMPADSSAWKMVVGRDVVVPVIHSGNPLIEAISRRGLTVDHFEWLFAADADWGKLVEGTGNTPLRCYLADNYTVRSKVADLAKLDESAVACMTMVSGKELIAAVQKDRFAVGFCRLADLIIPGTNAFPDNIRIIPFDKNRNGRVDSFENIYENPEEFTRGVWIGKYPAALCGNIYVLSSEKPTGQAALDFLSWIMGSGQELISLYGYSDLSGRELDANLLALAGPAALTNEKGDAGTATGWMLAVGASVLALLMVTLLVYNRRRRPAILYEKIRITPALNENSVHAPKGLFYDKSHTWAFMEPDGLVKIGLDDFMQHVTGKITRVKLKEPGEKVRKGEKILTIIRNGKQLEIYAPVSGIISMKNETLLDEASLINVSPYTVGWVYLIEPTNWLRETQFMFMVDKYKEWLEDEFIRLKDFFSMSVRSNAEVYEHVVLQDGGELTDHVLADLGPAVWEDFQIHFIDTSK
ncbi:hypothetical protein [Gaoshiqia sp. Z1-71]|uniref:hypothetical protein n=1 Tax=Gaoshiqia hydrogeniformans TaxID=3290090 RepID=UPI003BF90F0B